MYICYVYTTDVYATWYIGLMFDYAPRCLVGIRVRCTLVAH